MWIFSLAFQVFSKTFKLFGTKENQKRQSGFPDEFEIISWKNLKSTKHFLIYNSSRTAPKLFKKEFF